MQYSQKRTYAPFRIKVFLSPKTANPDYLSLYALSSVITGYARTDV